MKTLAEWEFDAWPVAGPGISLSDERVWVSVSPSRWSQRSRSQGRGFIRRLLLARTMYDSLGGYSPDVIDDTGMKSPQTTGVGDMRSPSAILPKR